MKNTSQTLKQFRDRGEVLLELEGKPEAWDQFAAWDDEVGNWLQGFGSNSDLLAEWKLLGSSELLSGRGKHKDDRQEWQYRMAVNKRLFWLKGTTGVVVSDSTLRNCGGYGVMMSTVSAYSPD